MLDSDILIEIKRDMPEALEWLASFDVKPSVCIFAALELLIGCQSLRDRRGVLKFLRNFLMAATAIEHNLTLYTFNVKHFRAVAGLSVVVPYVRHP